jgi:CubicO group peptidase (beta-lactamase class C family)
MVGWLPAATGVVPDGAVVQGELGKALDVYMTRISKQGFSGVLLVAKGDQIAIAKGYGLADRAQKRPFTTNTVFDIGSITKQFTAAAVLRLAEQGKLSPHDKIGKYFKEVPPGKAGITIHHLLSHSSGLRDSFGDDYDVMTRAAIVAKALHSKLLWKPRHRRYRYSNAGYSLLGAIVEIASGKAYEAYLRDELFKPAGMADTGYLLPKWEKSRLAHGYLRSGRDWGTPLDHPWDSDGPYWNLRANGGVLSTVGDLYRWHLALKGEQVLFEDSKQRMFTAHVREGPSAKTSYGYGWVIAETRRGTKLIVHNGGNEIFFADFRRYVDEDIVVIVASNMATHPANRYERGILDIIFGAGRR